MCKEIILLLVIMGLFSCKKETVNTKKNTEENANPTTLITVDTHKSQTKKAPIAKATDKASADSLFINLDVIKNCAKKGFSDFNMDSIDVNQNVLSDTFVNNTLGKMALDGYDNWKINANEWNKVSCHKWDQQDDRFIFSLLQKDENCCLYMYLCYTDTVGYLKAIKILALTGGDGGWVQNDQGFVNGFGKFQIISKIYDDMDAFETTDSVEYLSTITKKGTWTELTDSGFAIEELEYSVTDTLLAD